MAEIDEKMAALNFSAPTTKTGAQIAETLKDASELAGSVTLRTSVTQTSSEEFVGTVKNVVTRQFAVFGVTLADLPEGDGRSVQFTVGDYVRARDTVLGFIPVSPWRAPAYKPLLAVVEHLKRNL